MIKRTISTAVLLLLLSMAALAQVQATGPSITLTTSAFVAGATVKATGGIFDTTPDAFSKWQVEISIQPSGQRLRVIQVWIDHILFSLNADMDGVTGIRIRGFGRDEIVPLTGSATPAPAKPTITNKGRYSSDEFPGSGIAFDGVIDFGDSSVIQVALFGSDFGSVSAWIVRLSGNDAAGNPLVIEVRAQAHLVGQSTQQALAFTLGRSPVGEVQVQARAADVPLIQSNVVSIQVQ